MANLDNMKPSISSMLLPEARDLVSTLRHRRREAKAFGKPKKEVKKKDPILKMSLEDRRKLYVMLTGEEP